MLTCIIGTAVSGDELFGRQSFMDNIWSSISQGSILLLSPRRFGKTSVTFEMREFPRDAYAVHYFDVESLQKPSDLVIEILEKTGHLKTLTAKFKDHFKSLFGNIDELGFFQAKIKLKVYLDDDWQNKADDIFQKIFSENTKTIFILDELPSMLQNIVNHDVTHGTESAKLLLHWLRQVRMTYNIRFIVCGSIGIDQILRRCNAVETINDLKRLVLPPLSHELSKTMIGDLLDGFKIDYDEQMLKEIIDIVGIPIPFFIKILVQAIVNEIHESSTRLSKEVIHRAYKKRVLGVEGKGYFEHYFTRLKTYYTDGLDKVAKGILDHLAIHNSATKEELFNIFKQITQVDEKQPFFDLMELLEDDFYISYDEETKSYRFYTKILKDLWCKKLEN